MTSALDRHHHRPSLTTTATLAAMLVVLFPAAGASAQTRAPETGMPRRLTFRQTVDLALERGPEIQLAREGLRATQARVDAASAQRLPRLRTEANALYWDKAIEVSFGAPSAPPLTMRDQLTSQVSVTLAQPLSGLFVIGRLIDVERAGMSAAAADRERARLDAAYRASEAHLRLLQATAFRNVAETSLKQVEAQLGRARILEKGGVLGRVDVLRLEAAASAARQAVLRARSGAEVASRALALTLDLPSGEALEAVDDLPETPSPVVLQQGAARAAADQRPEVQAALLRAEQAAGGRSIARAQLLPNVMAVLTYQHTEGQGPFLPKNAGFAGLTLAWDIWDWGKNRNDVKEADARASQALLAAHLLRDQIGFEVERRLVDVRTASETLEVSASGLAAAEEAYRIQAVRFEQGAATTTDVIDAEAEVTRARTTRTSARYDVFLASVALARAVGQLPSAAAALPTVTVPSPSPAPSPAATPSPTGAGGQP